MPATNHRAQGADGALPQVWDRAYRHGMPGVRGTDATELGAVVQALSDTLEDIQKAFSSPQHAPTANSHRGSDCRHKARAGLPLLRSISQRSWSVYLLFMMVSVIGFGLLVPSPQC